jgi:hypothetical protein
MIQDLLAQDSPLAIIRSLGIYSLSFNGKECFPILVLDGSMGELHKYIGGGSTLNESLEIAVDYIEFLRTARPIGTPDISCQSWVPRTTVS